MMSDLAPRPTGFFRLVLGLVKVAAIVVGFVLTCLALAALFGLLTANPWVRWIPSIVIAIGVPLVLVERLLPDSNQGRARGLPTDVLAVTYSLASVFYFGLAHSLTWSATAHEADRLAVAGHVRLARTAYWLAAVEPTSPDAPLTSASNDTRKARASTTAAGKGAPSVVDGQQPKAAGGVDASPAATRQADAGAPDGSASKPAKKPVYSPQELFARFARAVVSIRGPSAMGTGFVIDDAGTFATNFHVVDKQGALKIKLKGGQWITKIELLATDKDTDLALLRALEPLKVRPLALGDSNAIKVGERVISIGNPLGLDHTLTDGLVSARRVYQGKKWVQMSAPVSPGNSGGPLFNMHGEVIGITTQQVGSMFGRAQNLNLAVPVNTLKKMVKDEYPNRRAVGSDAAETW